MGSSRAKAVLLIGAAGVLLAASVMIPDDRRALTQQSPRVFAVVQASPGGPLSCEPVPSGEAALSGDVVDYVQIEPFREEWPAIARDLKLRPLVSTDSVTVFRLHVGMSERTRAEPAEPRFTDETLLLAVRACAGVTRFHVIPEVTAVHYHALNAAASAMRVASGLCLAAVSWLLIRAAAAYYLSQVRCASKRCSRCNYPISSIAVCPECGTSVRTR